MDTLTTIAVILIILWLIGVLGVFSIGGYIHIFLIVAILLFIIPMIQGKNTM